MSVQTFLASFRGVPFISESSTTDGGRKTVTHEYPDQKERYVEDLGGKMKKFSIQGLITDTNNFDYYLKRTAFITALEMKGTGILTHPYYGIITVACVSFAILEENTRLGVAKFSLNFEETTNNIFPKFFGESLSGLNDLANNIIGLIGAGLITGVVSGNRNISDTAFKLISLSTLIKGSLPAATSVPSSIDQEQSNYLNDELITFNQNVYQYAQDSTSMFPAILTLLDDYNSTANTPDYAFNINKKLFAYGNNDKTILADTIYLRQRTINRATLNSSVRAIMLCYMYVVAAEITYTDNEQLNSYISILESLYLQLTINNNLDPNILAQLETLRTRTTIYLASLQISQVTTITVAQTPLTKLLYNYYESFDNENEIIALNNLLNPSVIFGTTKVVEVAA
jgi:hypothetical protein